MSVSRLRDFVQATTSVVSDTQDETRLLQGVRPFLQKLIESDEWLPDSFAKADSERYQQYLLHCDPLQRFSIVSFVWGPGQKTPIHNHTVWGLIGMLRGAEISTRFAIEDGQPPRPLSEDRLEAGMIDAVSPDIGDIHQVRNAFDDRPSVSIHVYGANIGKVKRDVFDVRTGQRKEFVSGFSSDTTPNIWV